MKCFLFLLCVLVNCGLHAQSSYQLTAYDYYFDPDTINAVVGDEIHLTLTTTEHNFTEVYDTTWAADHNTWNGGFAFGPGTANPGSHFIFTLDSVGTIWYVCAPHAETGMKGIINVAAGSTGTTENAELAPLKLFPNPASDQIVLIAPPGSPHTWVMVYDAHGLNVLSTDMRGIGKLDIKALEAGTYSVITTDDHGLPLAREKLVVTH